MKVEKNKVVALSYELTVEGRIADKAEAGHPLEYIQGTGMLLPKFEAEVEGKDEGDTFAFTLTPEEGYGVPDPAQVAELPVEIFKDESGEIRSDLLKEGATLPMMNAMGQVCYGIVRTVTESSVTMDFNHPMAGKTLNFSGKVEKVREATEKELKEGLHGEFLPKEEGCHCHGDGGGCHCHEDDGECHCHGEGGCGCDCK